MFAQFGEEFQFSPPYGDSTYIQAFNEMEKKFSPPYGDGTNSMY